MSRDQVDNNKRKRFDPSGLTDESLVTLRDVADHTRYSLGYLYNLRGRGRFIEPVNEQATTAQLRFRWGNVKEWIAKRPRPPRGDDQPQE